MARKKKETDPVHLKGYCPSYTKHMTTGQRYLNYLNLNDRTLLCSKREEASLWGSPVIAMDKSHLVEITEEEFIKD